MNELLIECLNIADRIINKNSNDVLYFIEKILELSKTESNLFEYEFQMASVNNKIAPEIETVRSVPARKGSAVSRPSGSAPRSSRPLSS